VWTAVTVALRPLERLGEVIADRSPDDLHPVTANTPEEVEPLVLAVNQFMDRLKTALDGLRNFTGNASHQLRTPLAVVRTQLALIDRSTGPEETAAAREKAKAALERAESVLSHLLVLARVDASASAAVLAPVDLAGLAKELTSEMVPAAINRDIDLGYEGCAKAVVAADPVLLAELLRNLLTNAISYSGSGSVVTVRVEKIAEKIVLAVEDNGPGLSDAQMRVAAELGRGAPRPSPHLAKSQSNGMHGSWSGCRGRDCETVQIQTSAGTARVRNRLGGVDRVRGTCQVTTCCRHFAVAARCSGMSGLSGLRTADCGCRH
jgi:two-component system, OmpR family, sensor histidine kinase TctE